MDKAMLMGAILVWCGALGLCNEVPVRASDPLSLAIAKVAANEGALWSLRDVDLIRQVVDHRATTPDGKLRWLQRHSARVLGDRPCYRGNCKWTKNLRRSGVLPAGLAAGDAYWRQKLKPRWEAVLRRASAPTYDPPCHLPPTTWGGEMDLERALERGLYPIGCDGVLNDGFRPFPRFGP